MDALHQPASLAEPPAAPAPAKQGGKTSSTSGGKAAAAAAAAGVQPAAVSLQLLLDPDLSDLPWEALSEVRRTCGSVGRCFSLAQLRDLLLPPQVMGKQQNLSPVFRFGMLKLKQWSGVTISATMHAFLPQSNYPGALRSIPRCGTKQC